MLINSDAFWAIKRSNKEYMEQKRTQQGKISRFFLERLVV